MKTRTLGPFKVSALGLGCMNLSHAYGIPPEPEAAAQILLGSLDLGYNFLDTAAMYGFGANETLIGRTLKKKRRDYILASKCGLFRNAAGAREIDGHPDVLKKTCDQALQRLQTDVIDLYYLHRWDKNVPIEDSVGALKELVEAGKIRTIGLSEVSAATIRKAHAVHPITAVESEYSLWTRNPEIATLAACRELKIGFVAFSPLGRGFLGGTLRDVSHLPPKDLRLAMPRFQGENWTRNLHLLGALADIAAETERSMAQLALAWVLAQGEDIVPIPGTTQLDHLAENAGAPEIELPAETLRRLDAAINQKTVSGNRYHPATVAEIDTEEF